MMRTIAGFLGMAGFVLLLSPSFAAGQHMMQPRVPADKLEEARALQNPITATPDILEKGKALYEGKGTCFNCHGKDGRGRGVGAANLNPPPRVFKSRGFWKHRTEGEIFWVIKNGSPGTAMIPFSGLLSDEEIWTVMLYERSFAGGHGRGGGGQGGSGMGGGHGKQGRHGGSHGQGSGCGGKQKGQSGHGEGKGQRGHRSGGCGSEGEDHHGKHHEDSLKQAEQAAAATITIEQAIQSATNQVTGRAIEAEFEMEEGTACWEVTVLSSEGKLMEVHIDSESGAMLSSEEKRHEKKKQKQMRKRKGRKGSHGSGHGGCAKKDNAEYDGHDAES